MSYVKNFEVGNVRLDTPNKHIVHELPLLSFGDACNTFALSLIFQSKLTTNPFYIANGYKLSIQKRIIVANGVPQSYEDGNGSLIKLNSCYSNKYAFDDGSMRFIRLIDNKYVLENPDYSKEIFAKDGRLFSVIDKYGNTILSYTYSAERLISVKYKDFKTVTFGYNSNGILQTIEYTYANVTYTTTFTYSGSEVIVSHYSGVDYHLTYSSGNFEVFSANAGGAYSNDMSYKDSVIVNGNVITIEKYRGDKKLDKVVYNFVNCDSSGKANILDITDFYNVRTRVQFMNEKPAYSYEMLDTMFVTHPTTNDPYYPGSVTFYNNEQASGSQGYCDGVPMNCYTGVSGASSNDYSTLHNFSGLMTVSGWLKPSYNLTESNILVYSGDTLVAYETVKGLVKDVWTYFTVSFFAEDSTSIHVVTQETADNILACDLRLMGQAASSTDNDELKDNLTKSSGVLIHTDSNGKDTPIPITDTVEYINGASPISKTSYPMTINDLMRFKINQAVGTNTGEIYYNDGRGILPLAGTFYIRYHAPGGSVITASLHNLAIGKMHTSKGNVYVTKTNFNFNNGITTLETQSLKNNFELNSEIYDDNLDLIESEVEGVITKYVRNATTGLVVEQTVTDSSNTSEMTSCAVYDANDFLVSTTDEYGVVTTYTTNATWGVVTKSSVSNGLTVTDTFDDDFSTQKSRAFGTGTVKKHEFTYFPAGLLYTIKNDTLNYTMGYTADILSSVTKNNQPMEQINISDDRKTMTAYYPGFLDTEYTITQRYDNYGRLTKIDGFITNTYDVNPTHNFTVDSNNVVHSNFSVTGTDNGAGKLATSTDHITGNITRYGYKNNNLTFAAEYDSAGNEVALEQITYDEFNRPKKKVSSCGSFGSVTSIVSYTSNEGDAYEGDTVKTCTYKVNNVQKAYTANSFDTFKRLRMKETKLNQNNFIKNFTYNGNRISKVTDTVLNMNLGTNNYVYDSMGRIVSNTYSSKNTSSNYRTYKYDQYGQLIRENNEGLDKTLIYEYNNIGNIVKVKEYDFTLSDTPSGTCTEKSYTYDSTYPDRLTNFNGSAIYYDSMGYPTSYGSYRFTWDKGKLTRIHRGSAQQPGSLYTDCKFTYDAYGRRLSKSYTHDPNPASTSDYSYTYNTTYNYDNSGRLLREYCTEKYISGTTNKREFIYLYDESGIIGVLYSYNGSTPVPYYYHRNLQGDVIAIYDASGYTKAEYTYDAWGNCTVTNSTLYDLAYNNPIRYRGYYYDRETGLYYLNARYYNPEWCRFVSSDSTEYINPDKVNGINLYVYCNNDPINKYDPTGHFVISTFLICLGAGALIGAALGGYTAYKEGQDILTGALTGAVLGAAVGAIIGVGGAVLSGAVSSVIGKTTTDMFSVVFYGGQFGSWEDYATAFVFGGITGSLGTVTGKFAKLAKLGKSTCDIVLRPLANQYVKVGTRGKTFNKDKYVYDVITRAATSGGSQSIINQNLGDLELKLDIGKCFYRATFRSIYPYISKEK